MGRSVEERKHERRPRVLGVDEALVVARTMSVTCATCANPIETDDAVYCTSCRIHWSNYDGGEDY